MKERSIARGQICGAQICLETAIPSRLMTKRWSCVWTALQNRLVLSVVPAVQQLFHENTSSQKHTCFVHFYSSPPLVPHHQIQLGQCRFISYFIYFIKESDHWWFILSGKITQTITNYCNHANSSPPLPLLKQFNCCLKTFRFLNYRIMTL